MQLVEVNILTTTAASDAVIEILMQHDAQGVQLTDGANGAVTITTYFEPTAPVLTDLAGLTAQIKGLSQFGLDVGAGKVTTKDLDSTAWENNWKQYYHTTQITNRTVIVPTWEDYHATNPATITLKLDPQKSFGTGTHPTTSLMIQALEFIVRDDDWCLDVGTGSGVLAIMAAKLGVKHVWAADVSDDALAAARSNIAENGVADQIMLVKNDLLTGVTQQASLICANILPEFLLPLIPQAKTNLTAGGHFLLSGIIQEAAPEVLACLAANGFKVVQQTTDGKWVAIIAQKPKED